MDIDWDAASSFVSPREATDIIRRIQMNLRWRSAREVTSRDEKNEGVPFHPTSS